MSHILFLLTQDLESPSGLGRYLPMAKELSKLGHTVSISALHGNFRNLTNKKFIYESVSVEYVGQMHVLKEQNGKKYFSAVQLLIIVIKATVNLTIAAMKSHADILVIGKPHPMNGLAGAIAGLSKRTKLIVDCDDYESGVNRFSASWQKRIVAYFEEKLPKIATYVTTNTFFTRNRLINQGILPEKIIYISNGIEENRFSSVNLEKLSQLRINLGINTCRVIGYVGTLGKTSHPVDLLIDAFKVVSSILDDVCLLFVGTGEDIEELKNMVIERKLENKVFFTGRVPADQVSLYYSLMEVSVDPIFIDDAALGRSPLKMFESWACGIPFITGDVGDRKELCGDPASILLVEPGSTESLANGIIYLLTHNEEAARLKIVGLNKIIEFYWSNIICHAKNIFE